MTAKVDLILKIIQRQVFITEGATAEQVHNIQEVSPEYEKKDEEQQEISYINGHGYMQNQSYNQNPNVRNNLQLFSYWSNNIENLAAQVQKNQAQGSGYQKNS